MPALVTEDQLHSSANARKPDGQAVERVEHRVLPSQEDHALEHHVVQTDRGGQTLAVLGEAQGSGRESLLEQGDELGTDEGAKNFLPSRDVGPRDGRHLGRDEVEALLALGQAAAGAWGDLVSPGAAEKAARMHRTRLRTLDIKFF